MVDLYDFSFVILNDFVFNFRVTSVFAFVAVMEGAFASNDGVATVALSAQQALDCFVGSCSTYVDLKTGTVNSLFSRLEMCFYFIFFIILCFFFVVVNSLYGFERERILFCQ